MDRLSLSSITSLVAACWAGWMTVCAPASPALAQPADPDPASPAPADRDPAASPPDTADPDTADPGTANPDTTPGPGTRARLDAERTEPAILWRTFHIAPDLPARQRRVLRTVFEPQMIARRSLTEESQNELKAFARRIGYELVQIEPKRHQGATAVALHLEPLTLVRRVRVDIDNSLLEIYKFNTIFEDEITRRMRLRRGTPLARDPAQRRLQLDVERERIADYLRGEGFFDAQVAIEAVPEGDDAVRLNVTIIKGARYAIGRIAVTGNTSIPASEIAAQFRHGKLCAWFTGYCITEERFSRQNLNRDIQKVVKLYQRRGYPAVRVRTDFDPATSFKRDREAVDFTVIINERRKIEVFFEGNNPKTFPDQTLKQLLTFNEEGSYDDVEVEASAEAIRRHYQARGYFEANVTYAREPFGFFERIGFTIDPGPRLAVRHIAFEGNRALTSRALRAAITTRVATDSQLFGFGSGGNTGHVTSAQLAGDVARIEAAYRRRGHIGATVQVAITRSPDLMEDAAVLSALVASSATSKGLYIRFHIDEGEQTTVSRVRFVGNTAPEATLRKLVGVKTGDPYDAERIRRGAKALERYYFERAYPRARIAVKTPDELAGGSVEIIYEIAENRAARIGEILIHGNFKTQEWVIRDELGFRKGDPLDLGRVETAQQNLRASGLFNSVRLTPIGLDKGQEQDIHIVLQVEERHDYMLGLEAAAGLSSDRGLLLELGLNSPNVAGTGLRLELNGQYATEIGSLDKLLSLDSEFFTINDKLISLEGKLIAPQWMVRRAIRAATLGALVVAPRFEATAFLRQEPTERFGDLTSYGTSAAFSKLGRYGFWKNWLFLLRYDLRLRNRDRDLIRSPGPSDDIERSPTSTRTGAIGPQLIIDRRIDEDGRPNPLAPKAGWRLEAKALFAGRYMLGEDEFIKIGLSGQHFFQPARRVLISNGVRYDHGFPLGEVLLPEVERFFAGGDTTVRGFEEDRLATEIITSPIPPLADVQQLRVLPAGGNIRLVHNLDFQIEVWEALGVPVASAVFLDTGLVTNSLDGFKFSDLRHSIGVALIRWVSPLSSLSFEWAVPLDPKIGDNPRGRWHFNLGLLF